MSGPSAKRADVNTAPFPGITPQAQDFLSSFLNQYLTPGQPAAQPTFTGQKWNPFSAGPRVPQGLTGNPLENPFIQAIQQGYQSMFGQNPGQQVINAAQPIFERNLADARASQREFGGPRFSSEAVRQDRLLQERALQDFNLFQQQALQQGQQTQLGALGGAGQLGLGLGGQNLQLLMAALMAGGAGSPPVINQNPGTFANLTGLVGGAASLFPFTSVGQSIFPGLRPGGGNG